WTGTINPGISDKLVCTIDFAASFAEMTGVQLPPEACLDSFDVLGALLGSANAAGRGHLVQQDNGRGGNYGLRAGNWKLQRHDSRRRRNARLRLKGRKVARYTLYQLNVDPGETTDVLAKHPDVAQQMIRQLEKLITAGRSRISP
ncbi:MAG TPA: arylsulfatase, partial [Planctomycetaceae bacterium]|nr:arylsulfatase [Planctomycetaceae bacterium]